jgi:hypothetical protein
LFVLLILVELLTIYCLEVIVRFVDIGGIVDHHCLEVIVRFVDIGGIVDHHCCIAYIVIRLLPLT